MGPSWYIVGRGHSFSGVGQNLQRVGNPTGTGVGLSDVEPNRHPRTDRDLVIGEGQGPLCVRDGVLGLEPRKIQGNGDMGPGHQIGVEVGLGQQFQEVQCRGCTCSGTPDPGQETLWDRTLGILPPAASRIHDRGPLPVIVPGAGPGVEAFIVLWRGARHCGRICRVVAGHITTVPGRCDHPPLSLDPPIGLGLCSILPGHSGKAGSLGGHRWCSAV